ncbi:MAG: hypothetical protein ABI833_09995 [Acidobacteriota bacterium]
MLTSLPAEKPQPNQEFYGLDLLNLFETYTRAQFEAAGGPLIPFDPARPEQNWWDDTYAAVPPTQTVGYHAVVSGSGGTAAIGSFTQTAAQRATPNFKGLPNYPKWTLAATRAVYNHAAPSTTSPVDPRDLSSAQQAQALLGEFGGTSIVDVGANSVTLPNIGQIVFPVTYPPDEARRLFAVVLSSGKLFNVGQALAAKYAAGMGAPGAWVADAMQVSGWSWQSTAVPDGSASTAAALPIPCRPLFANERLMTALVGGLGFQITQVQRTDLIPASASNGSASDPVLLDVQAKVTALYNLIVLRS